MSVQQEMAFVGWDDLLEARRGRAATVRGDLVHPGWTLLLVLYRAHLDGRPVRMARLATEAHVAFTTMMRWLTLFIADGLVERRADPSHRRRVSLLLTAEGAERVRRQLLAECGAWVSEAKAVTN